MRSRQNLVDIFSTYIQFENDRFQGWLADARLRNSMERCLAQTVTEQPNKQTWALYWHEHWRQHTHTFAALHLGAYLQEAAYWAAQKFTQFQLPRSSLADRFQIAFTQFEQGLKQFTPDRGSSLESFAKMFFTSTITNELRRTQELDLCSDWMLLRKTSLKKFIESLRNQGLDDAAIAHYRLAWTCFKQLYAPSQVSGTRQLPPPDQHTWENITQLYNQQLCHHLPTTVAPVTAEQLEDWLQKAIGWLRSYSQPSVKSLSDPIPGGETGELQDTLPSPDRSPMNELLEQVEQSSQKAQQTHLRQFLQDHLNTLSASEQALLKLYYGDHLSQQQIAQQLNTKQYSVSRQLTRIRKKLLEAVMTWCQETERVTLSPDQVEHIAEALEIWLQEFWQSSVPLPA